MNDDTVLHDITFVDRSYNYVSYLKRDGTLRIPPQFLSHLNISEKFPVMVEAFRDCLLICPLEKMKLNSIYLEITSKCNLNCIMCIRRAWRDEIGDMDFKLLKKIIHEAKELGVEWIWFAGYGEPLIYEHFEEAVKEVKQNKIKLGITTNGTLIDEDMAKTLSKYKVDRVVISIDSPFEEKFKKIRGTEVSKIIRNVKNLEKKAQESKKPEIWIEFVVMKDNIEDLPALVDLAGNSGATTVLISNLLPYTYELAQQVLYFNGSNVASDVILEASKRAIASKVRLLTPYFELKTQRSCNFIEKGSCVVTWDGDVCPCYNFMHTYPCIINGRKKMIHKVSFGNLNNQSLKDTWLSPKYVKFRIIVKNFSFPSCTDCEFQEFCWFVEENLMDCWGNSPSCADCLWARKIIQCP